MRTFLKRKSMMVYGVLILGALILIVTSSGKGNITTSNDAVVIILASTLEDAVLSLDELVTQGDNQKIIATFFSKVPTAEANNLQNVKITHFTYVDSEYAGDEGKLLLQTELSKDIQSLISSVGNKPIQVYGPAGQEIIRDALTDVIRNFPKDKVEFYFYEHEPFTREFNKTSVISLERHLENITQFALDKVEIPHTRHIVYKVRSF
ncbi:hypothetical protein KW782_01615 [Candidatus Parcubacteria bacterium]|nr:hypothetical protein [Candidatus Parcubacteria bacterium]